MSVYTPDGDRDVVLRVIRDEGPIGFWLLLARVSETIDRHALAVVLDELIASAAIELRELDVGIKDGKLMVYAVPGSTLCVGEEQR